MGGVPVMAQQSKTSFDVWTREALEAEIKALRSTIEQQAKELAKPMIKEAEEKVKHYEEATNELRAVIEGIQRMPAEALVDMVNTLTQERVGLFGTKRKLNLAHMGNYPLAYHYKELKAELKKKGFIYGN